MKIDNLKSRNLLNPKQTAELLGITTGTLSVWRCAKRYPLSYIKIGKKVRYDSNDIEKFIRSRTIEINLLQDTGSLK